MSNKNQNLTPNHQTNLIQKIYMVADHAGYDLLQELHKALTEDNHIGQSSPKKVFLNLSNKLDPTDDYPKIIENLNTTILNNTENQHNNYMCIAICGSGQGVCMALNRYSYLRAGIGFDQISARTMREHNQANCLCLSSQHLNLDQALKIAKIFLETEPSKELRHTQRVEMLAHM